MVLKENIGLTSRWTQTQLQMNNNVAPCVLKLFAYVDQWLSNLNTLLLTIEIRL